MAGPQKSMPLGEYLLTERICSREQLEAALNAQVVYGGKLGTNLLEQGAIDLRILARALGKIHHVRALDPMQPIRIRPELLKVLPAKVARAHSAVPLALEGKRLYVLVMDPDNRRALEVISRATGREVVPVVLPEVRHRILLEKYYGVQQELRYLTLARNLAANDGKIPPPKAAAQEEDLMPEEIFEQQIVDMARPDSSAAPGLHVVDREQLAETEPDEAEILDVSEEDIIPLNEEDGEDWAVYMERDGAEPVDLGAVAEEEPELIEEEELLAEEAAPLAPIDLKQAMDLLAGAHDREDIARAVLQLSMKIFKRAVLFIVRHGQVSGWDAVGEGINQPLLRNLIISTRQPSAFKLVHDTSAHFLGAVPPGEINDAFLKLLGGDRPRSAFLYPILFQGKVVNVIYGDGGPGKNAPVDVSDLLILGPRVPQTFERILKERKKQVKGAPGSAA